MGKKPREFIDVDRPVMDEFYDVVQSYTGRNLKTIQKKLEKLIRKDPDFLDSYSMLAEVIIREKGPEEAEKLSDEAFNRAINLITDKNGNWPEILEWGWLENRHIIRTLLNKAIMLWDLEDLDPALDLFRKLLRSNPGDNIGAREFILAIRMKMTHEQFEKRFNKGGFYDMKLMDWFEKNHKKYPDDFDWWDKWCEKNL